MADKDGKTLENEYSIDILRDISNFVDANIQIIRLSTLGLATVGVVLIGRNIHAWKRFTNVSEIPRRFIDKNVKLQGKLKKVGVNGVLYVEHVPIFSARYRVNPELLPVKLCAVSSMQEPGMQWLEKSMKNRHIWFQMLALNKSRELESVVYYQGPFFNRVYANDYLVKKGLATVEPIEPKTRKAEKYMERISALEFEAQRKGRGTWAPPPLMERMKTRSKLYVDGQVASVKHSIDSRVDAVKSNISTRVDNVKANVSEKVVNVKEDVNKKVNTVTAPVIKTANVVIENVNTAVRIVKSCIASVQSGVNAVKESYQKIKAKVPKLPGK